MTTTTQPLSGESLEAKFDRLAMVHRAAEREAVLCRQEAAELVATLLADAGITGVVVEATEAGVLVKLKGNQWNSPRVARWTERQCRPRSLLTKLTVRAESGERVSRISRILRSINGLKRSLSDIALFLMNLAMSPDPNANPRERVAAAVAETNARGWEITVHWRSGSRDAEISGRSAGGRRYLKMLLGRIPTDRDFKNHLGRR